MIKKLLNCGVTQDQIVVLSPYRAQCHIIQEDLTEHEFSVSVSSIVKSQGMLAPLSLSEAKLTSFRLLSNMLLLYNSRSE